MQFDSVSNFSLPAEVPASVHDAATISLGNPGRDRSSAAARMKEFLLRSKNRAFSIIGGGDERSIQTKTQHYPWRAICALEIDFGDQPAHATGWLAGPRTIITAGHCIYDHDRPGGWAGRARATPGRSGLTVAPFGTLESSRFSCLKEWQTNRTAAADLGCVHLDQDIGTDVGWFGFDPVDWGVDEEVSVVIAGYPIFDSQYKDMLQGQGPIKATEAGLVFYGVDTDQGQSGSPVWRTNSTAGPVIATHAYRKEDLDRATELDANAGVQISSEVRALILKWNQSSS